MNRLIYYIQLYIGLDITVLGDLDLLSSKLDMKSVLKMNNLALFYKRALLII